MSLFCLFSLFVMGKLFLRKVKFYVRNVTKAATSPNHEGVEGTDSNEIWIETDEPLSVGVLIRVLPRVRE
jgi:hypothetical protein